MCVWYLLLSLITEQQKWVPPIFMPFKMVTVQFSSVQSLSRLDRQEDMRHDSAEIFFQSFLQEALDSSSGMGRDVHSLLLFLQHFLCWPQRRPPSKVPWRIVCRGCRDVWWRCSLVKTFSHQHPGILALPFRATFSEVAWRSTVQTNERRSRHHTERTGASHPSWQTRHLLDQKFVKIRKQREKKKQKGRKNKIEWYVYCLLPCQ